MTLRRMRLRRCLGFRPIDPAEQLCANNAGIKRSSESLMQRAD